MIKLGINKTKVTHCIDTPITAGTIGEVVYCTFSEEWNSFTTKIASVVGSSTARVIVENDSFVIPGECLKKAGNVLKIAIQGISYNEDGSLKDILPTEYENISTIEIGADSFDESETEEVKDFHTLILEEIEMLKQKVSELEKRIPLGD